MSVGYEIRVYLPPALLLVTRELRGWACRPRGTPFSLQRNSPEKPPASVSCKDTKRLFQARGPPETKNWGTLQREPLRLRLALAAGLPDARGLLQHRCGHVQGRVEGSGFGGALFDS